MSPSGNTNGTNIVIPGEIKGYPMLAREMEIQPELSLFRRFGSLNALNLLYLQAELVSLEADLDRQQLEDHNSNDGNKVKYAVNWCQLRASHRNGDTKQLDLVLKVRETLQQYNEAFMQYAQILSYPDAGSYDLKFMQSFLHSSENMDLCLLGPDATVWGSVTTTQSHSVDLAQLCPRQKEDPISSWVTDKAVQNFKNPGWRLLFGSSQARERGIVAYDGATILQVTSYITSVVASLLLIGSIAILLKVPSTSARLGVIAIFNVLLNLCLVAFTNAERTQVFTITAAFAAVQTVFVGADKC